MDSFLSSFGGNAGINQNKITTKADAMKYAFELTTERNLATGETKVNTEKALEVFKAFTDNIDLPECPIDPGKQCSEGINNFLAIISDYIRKYDREELTEQKEEENNE